MKTETLVKLGKIAAIIFIASMVVLFAYAMWTNPAQFKHVGG
tara:strand:- start:142 stop:267 length:126 start_codon:yes stop_codon:yes gene_type:complete